jgi:hypothetical protein
MLKFFEIRDRMTTIAAVGIGLGIEDIRYASNQAVDAITPAPTLFNHISGLAKKSGFWQSGLIILVRLDPLRAESRSHIWGEWRTMRAAHEWIEKNFSDLPAVSVVDVEYILGEVDEPKRSELLP